MIKWFKRLFTVSEEDRKLAESIRELCKTHDVTIIRSGLKGWRVSVKRKKQ